MFDDGSWTTLDELQFLRYLGFHRPENNSPRNYTQDYPRRAQLIAYRAAMAARVNWGEINPVRVAAYVDHALRYNRDKRPSQK